ncbi:hypothetical protein EV361DRAFT_441269 [Lentinula raphanica]|nr:hypothetical protein EV361DRAFT_441269 [Lentinula raphanica]
MYYLHTTFLLLVVSIPPSIATTLICYLNLLGFFCLSLIMCSGIYAFFPFPNLESLSALSIVHGTKPNCSASISINHVP